MNALNNLKTNVKLIGSFLIIAVLTAAVGTAKVNQELIILLNLSKILNTSETSVLESFAGVSA